MAKIVTIIGATGAQGRGVAAAFLNDPAYRVRAVTRNSSSANAQALAAQGAEVVQADLESPASLSAALAGSHVVFGVTNFFEPFAALQDPARAAEAETRQGINLAEAAARTDGLEHYVWSTLPDAGAVSGGRRDVPHFSSKSRVDAHIRARLPALAAKTTFLWVSWYASNYRFPVLAPVWVPGADRYVQLGACAGETPIETIGDVERNIGSFVKAVVERGEKTKGEIVLAAAETTTVKDMLQLWARVKGAEASFVRVGGDVPREIWPLWGEEIAVNLEFFDECKEKSWTDVEGRRVLRKEDLGITGLEGLEEAFRRLEL